MRVPVLLLLILSTLYVCNLNLLSKEWIVFDSTNSPIPSNHIVNIVMDSMDNKWVASNGVAKFDNSKWTVFDEPGNWLYKYRKNAIATDKQGNIWIGDSTGGINKFDGAKLEHYDVHDSVNHNIKVLSINFDPDGNILCGIANGFMRYNGSTWESIRHPYFTEYATTFAFDSNGKVWIGSNSIKSILSEGVLGRYKNGTWEVTFTFGGQITSLAIDRQNNVWVAYNACSLLENEGGIRKFSNDLGSLKVYRSANSPLPHDSVNAIAFDSKGNAWIGTVAGLAKFDGSNWVIYNTSNSDLPDNHISSILIDKQDNIWIGTKEGGVAVYNEAGVKLDAENKETGTDSKMITRTIVSDILEVPPSLGLHRIELYNVLGIKVLDTEYLDRINMSCFLPGVYFLKAGNAFMRILKQ